MTLRVKVVAERAILGEIGECRSAHPCNGGCQLVGWAPVLAIIVASSCIAVGASDNVEEV